MCTTNAYNCMIVLVKFMKFWENNYEICINQLDVKQLDDKFNLLTHNPFSDSKQHTYHIRIGTFLL